MVTRNELINIIRDIVSRDKRIEYSIEVYEKLSSLIGSPYTGETQYHSFLVFLKGVMDGMSDEMIVEEMLNNPGYINIIRTMKDDAATAHIDYLRTAINNNYDKIEEDFKYLTIFRKVYAAIMMILVTEEAESELTPSEADASGKFLISAYECNPYMSFARYRDLINALYDAVFHFLFVSQGTYHPNDSILYSDNINQIFRANAFFSYVPVYTKLVTFVRSSEMNNVIEVSKDAVNYIMDFYWMIEPYGRLECIKEYMYLFDLSDEI